MSEKVKKAHGTRSYRVRHVVARQWIENEFENAFDMSVGIPYGSTEYQNWIEDNRTENVIIKLFYIYVYISHIVYIWDPFLCRLCRSIREESNHVLYLLHIC